MGSPEPLSVLVQRLTACMAGGADATAPVTEMLIQNTILELATRKSYGPRDGASLLQRLCRLHCIHFPARHSHQSTNSCSWGLCTR